MQELLLAPVVKTRPARMAPSPSAYVMSGIRWGRPDVLFTPAYWKSQVEYIKASPPRFKLGGTLREEVAACLLGGYGIPAEVGLAAFRRLRDDGMLAGRVPNEDKLTEALTAPLSVGGRSVRYRFARQRSRYVHSALSALNRTSPPDASHLSFREWFLQLPGIGPKTASWITRNWLGSDFVAIIDIHIFRAGVIAGFFCPRSDVVTDYFKLEERYLAFCAALHVRPSVLDALIWQQMREAGTIALAEFRQILASPSDTVKLRKVA